MNKIFINNKESPLRNFKFSLKKIVMIVTILVVLTLLPIPLLYNYNYGQNFSNSFFSSHTFSGKTVMIIVPHQDDEINVAGPTIKTFVDGGANVIVVFTTNGDYYGLGETRINESINAMNKLGVSSENVQFLGYGDQWDTEHKHIYHAPEHEVIESYIGNMETYGSEESEDFRSTVSNTNSLYTRKNYKNDVKDIILKYSPEILFAVDFDLHIDHRATSLIFEEVMGELLRENETYEPIVFKGFAYNTAWHAVKDFYSINMEATLLPDREKVIDSDYELDVPHYNWKDRVRFPVPKEMLSYTKRSNLLYEALGAHKSQGAKNHTEEIVNSDKVFWERNTSSITYNATIEVSSGESEYINDFKLIDSSDISGKNIRFDRCVWIPDKDDTEKSVKIKFDKPSDIYSISLYDNFSLEDNILKGALVFSDGSKVEVKNLNENGAETKIYFPVKNNIEFVEFKIEEYQGKEPGLCELEVFSEEEVSDIEYIKLMVDNELENFMYRYTVLEETEVPLNIYSYSSGDNEINIEDYKISIISGNEVLRIEDNVLKISEDRKPGKYKIRAELIDNPMVFDEVEINIPNSFQKAYYKFITFYEQQVEVIEEFFSRVYISLKYRMSLIKDIIGF